MQIITKDQCEQGSEAWLQLRMGVATASDFDNIITPLDGKESKSLPAFAQTLALEILYENIEEGVSTYAMGRGKEHEPFARQAYCEENFCVVEEIAMFKSDCGNFGASPDALVGDDGLIEIKTRKARLHYEFLVASPEERIKMAKKLSPQIQGQLWISERKWCDLLIYNHFSKVQKLIKIRVERDEAYIAELARLAQKTITMRDEILKQIRG